MPKAPSVAPTLLSGIVSMSKRVFESTVWSMASSIASRSARYAKAGSGCEPVDPSPGGTSAPVDRHLQMV